MYNEIINKLKDKNIAILGFGKEGKSTYNFIRRYLQNQKLTIIDKKEQNIDDNNVTIISGDNYLDNLGIYDLIIKSPGITLKDIDITNFKDKITSQLELVLEVYRKNIIGITGTKGKSTTTSLIYEIIRNQKDNVFILGNIGIPLLDQVEEYNENSTLVIEMSSDQLEFVHNSPHISIILNLFEDHLDHAGTIEHYHDSKLNIFKYQDEEDFCIYSDDNEYLHERMKSDIYKATRYNIRFDNENITNNATRIINKEVYLNNELLYIDTERELIGDHNLKNIMFALTVSKILNLDLVKAKDVIVTFKGLKYRMEKIGTFDDITYYNDTIATIPDATINAIEAIKNVDTLIFGGMDRKINYTKLINFLKESNISNLICMPTTGTNIGHILEQETSKNIFYTSSLEEAHKIAKEHTKKGYSCLLSPAASSYEYFKNFEEKGKCFEEIVRNN